MPYSIVSPVPAPPAPPQAYAPELALVLYRLGDQAMLIKHPVLTLPPPAHENGAPAAPQYALGAGVPAAAADTTALWTATHGGALVYPSARTIAHAPHLLAFWRPPGPATMTFAPKHDANRGAARFTGRPVPLPGLLLVARPGHLSVYATPDAERPTPATPLHHAPLWNMLPSAEMCRGTVAYPAALTPSTEASWEAALLQSTFTGPSRTDRYVRWGASYEELLQTAVEDGHFPLRTLLPTGQTIQEVLQAVTSP